MECGRAAPTFSLVALLDDYHDALDAFMAGPTESTKRGVLTARAKLPDAISGDGVTTQLPNGSTLEGMLDGMLNGARRANPRRLIDVGVRHEG